MPNPLKGEFRVDFDDEDEGEAWISVRQQWRLLGPSFEEAVSEQHAGKPVLQVQAQQWSPAPAEAEAVTAEAPAAAAPDPPAEDWLRIVRAEFAQLHAAAVASDGCAHIHWLVVALC